MGWINDPIVGVLADRVHTRWGRRRPFFLFGALPFALTVIALWWVPPWDAPLAKMLYYVVAYMLWDTVFTLVSIPYAALTPELTEDYDERTRLNGYRMVVSMAGGLIAAVAVPYFAGLFPQPKTGYLLMAVIFGILGALPYLLLFFGIRERFVAAPATRPRRGRSKRGEALLSIFRNRPFRYAAGIYLTAWVTISLVAALFQYFLTYPMQMPDQVEIVLGLLQASALLFTAAAVWLGTHWGKQQTYITGVLWLSAIVLSLTFLQPGNPPVVFVLAVLAGLGVAVAQVIPWAIVPDVIEADELATGKRREATYYGVLTFAQKGGTALALALMQGVLALTGYVAGAQQPPSALLAMRLHDGAAAGSPAHHLRAARLALSVDARASCRAPCRARRAGARRSEGKSPSCGCVKYEYPFRPLPPYPLFARARCRYCDFNTYAGMEGRYAPYVVALSEADPACRAARGRLPVRTIFIGGGTPTVLPPEILAQALEACQAAFAVAPDAEITCEANPGTVDQAHFVALKALGVNRLSMGVQSFDAAELRWLERIHSTAEAEAAFAAARGPVMPISTSTLCSACPARTRRLGCIPWRRRFGWRRNISPSTASPLSTAHRSSIKSAAAS